MDIKTKIIKLKQFSLSPERPIARANKASSNLMIFILNLILVENFCNRIIYKIFQYGLESVLIQRILIGLEAILETPLQTLKHII